MFEQSLLWCCFLCDCTLCLCLMLSVHLNPSHAAVWRSTLATTASASIPPCCWTSEKQHWQLLHRLFIGILSHARQRAPLEHLQLFKAHFVFSLSYDIDLWTSTHSDEHLHVLQSKEMCIIKLLEITLIFKAHTELRMQVCISCLF